MNPGFEVVAGMLGCGFLVTLVSLSGLFALWIKPERLDRPALGDAFIHLIPDAVERQGSVTDVCLTTLAGLFLFFILEKRGRWRQLRADSSNAAVTVPPLAKMNLIGDGIHNENAGLSSLSGQGAGFMQFMVFFEQALLAV